MAIKSLENSKWAALISVREGEQISPMLTELGWKIVDEFAPSADYGKLYNTSALKETILESVANPEDSSRIHLITFKETNGVPIRPMRKKISCYQIGGLFDLNFRTFDNDMVAEILRKKWKLGFNSSKPALWTFGDLEVSEWIAVSKEDGLIIATMQRINPPVANPPKHLIGQLINSTHMTENFESSIGFYGNTFGYQKIIDEQLGLSNHPMQKILPTTQNEGVFLDLALLSRKKVSGLSMIEVARINHTGEENKPVLEKFEENYPPNLGLYALRYTVEPKDLESIAKIEDRYIKKVVSNDDTVVLTTVDNYLLEFKAI